MRRHKDRRQREALQCHRDAADDPVRAIRLEAVEVKDFVVTQYRSMAKGPESQWPFKKAAHPQENQTPPASPQQPPNAPD